MAATYKIAIAISGAESLGSYESGTLYELIHAIKLHNEQNPNQKIEIDVLSGASAGGITAAMVAQKLLFDADALEDPDKNSLFDVWVNRSDILDFLNFHPNEDLSQSLLSSNHIWDNARHAFFQRYQKGSNPVVKSHLASANTIQLGMALSNLNGVDYQLPTYTNSQAGIERGEFVQTRNQDRYTVSIDAACDNQAFWEKVVRAGLASGAFPVAFSPVELQREWATDDYQGRGAKNWAPDFDGQFTYVDGGMFNNYPLGMARSLARRVDEISDENYRRYYFYISPSTKTSSADYNFRGSKANIFSCGFQILKSIYNNSGFQDWVQTDDINGSINRLHEQAELLLDVVMQMEASAIEVMLVSVQKICYRMYEKNGRNFEADQETIEKNFLQYWSHLQQELTAQQKQLWIMMVLTMESSANLTDKEKMRIYNITAKDSELSGSSMAGFLGFFDKRFRQLDYLVGLLKARQTINDIIEAVESGSCEHLPLRIEPLQTSDIQYQLDELQSVAHASIDTVDRSTREKTYLQIKTSIAAILKRSGVKWYVRWFVVHCVARSAIRKFLALR